MANKYWLSAKTGNWTDAANWSGNAAPGAADNVFIDQTGIFTFNVTSAVSVNALEFDSPGATFLESALGKITTATTFRLGGGVAILNGTNSFGALELTGATLQFSSNAALGGGTMLLASGAFKSTAAATVSNTFALDGGVGTTLEIDSKTGTTLTLGSGGWQFGLDGQHIVIGGSGNTGKILWNGGATATVSNNSTNPTTVTVASGTLKAGDGTLTPLFSAHTTIASGATVDLNGFDTTMMLDHLAAGGIITNTSSTLATLTVGNFIESGDAAGGIIAGNIALAIANTFAIDATQTYTGGTTINPNSDLTINGTGQVKLAGAIVDNGGFDYFSNWTATASYGAISGTGGLTVFTEGTLALNTANSFSGGTEIIGGTVSLGKAFGFGTGAVVFDAGPSNPAVLIGTATETLANTIDLEGASTIAAATGTTLTLTKAGAFNVDSDFVNNEVNLQIGDATHTGTVVMEAGGGFSQTNTTILDVTLAGGTLMAGDNKVMAGLLSADSFTAAAGTTLDLNGQTVRIGTNFHEPDTGTFNIVNSASTVASVQFKDLLFHNAPTGNIAVSLVDTTLIVANGGSTGGTTIDSLSTLVLGPTGSDPLAVQAAYLDETTAASNASFGALAHAATTFKGPIADGGGFVALVTAKTDIAGGISGGGIVGLFGTGPAASVELAGNNSGFSGEIVAQDIGMVLDRATSLGAATYRGYDTGILAQTDMQIANTLDLHGDTSLLVANGALAKLTGELDFDTGTRTGDENTHLSISFGDAAHKGAVLLNTAAIDLTESGTQPLFVDVNGGTLKAGNAGSLQGLASLASGFSIASGAKVDLNGFELDITSWTSAGTITNSAASTAGLVSHGDAIAGGTLSGNLQLGVEDGTLTFTGAATNTAGAVILSGATLQLGTGAGGGTFTDDITDNGTLTFDHSTNVTYAGKIDGNGNIVTLGTGVLTLSGNETFSGTAILKGQSILAISGSWNEFVQFNGKETLKLVHPDTFSGVIKGFSNGGTVDLTGIATAGATKSWDATTSKLTVTSGSTTDVLKFATGLKAGNFKLVADGNGGTEVVYVAAAQAPQPDAFVFPSAAHAQASHSDTAIHDTVVAEPASGVHANIGDFAIAGHVDLFALHEGAHHGDLLI